MIFIIASDSTATKMNYEADFTCHSFLPATRLPHRVVETMVWTQGPCNEYYLGLLSESISFWAK
jgi:hypothetical protein